MKTIKLKITKDQANELLHHTCKTHGGIATRCTYKNGMGATGFGYNAAWEPEQDEDGWKTGWGQMVITYRDSFYSIDEILPISYQEEEEA